MQKQAAEAGLSKKMITFAAQTVCFREKQTAHKPLTETPCP